MKNSFKCLLALFILCSSVAYSDDDSELPTYEVAIYNRSQDVLKIQVYPVGVVFNGDLEYKLRCKNPIPNSNIDYITGVSIVDVQQYQTIGLNHDSQLGNAGDCQGAIGYGKYRIDIFRKVGSVYNFVDYLIVDFGHSNYPWNNNPHLQNEPPLIL